MQCEALANDVKHSKMLTFRDQYHIQKHIQRHYEAYVSNFVASGKALQHTLNTVILVSTIKY